MRALADAQAIERLMQALGREADRETNIYFAGGATAVLLGWRPSTLDVDLKMEPEIDSVLRALPRLKESLHINVELALASPVNFIPVRPDWRETSSWIATHGMIAFRHFDLYAQALAKVERGHAQDLDDVREMLRRELIDPQKAIGYFEGVGELIYKFPPPRSLDLSPGSGGGFSSGGSPRGPRPLRRSALPYSRKPSTPRSNQLWSATGGDPMARPKKYEEDRITTAIRLPKRTHDRLRQVARERDVSVSWLLTKAADHYLEQLQPPPEPASVAR